MVGGDAVGQGVGAAGIFRHVAADGAGALAGGVGGIKIAACLDRQGDVQVDHPGLHHGALVFQIDFEDPVHASESDEDSALERDGAAGESGSGAPADERHLELARDFDQRRDIRGAAGEDHQVGAVFIDAAIVLVQSEVFGAVEHAARTEQGEAAFLAAGWNHSTTTLAPSDTRGRGRRGRAAAGRTPRWP